jgi:UDPglucose 6-dehydrogenase
MELAADCDAVVLMVAHSAYKEIDLSTLHTKMKTPVFLDGRHVMDKEKMNQAGFDYYCVGVGNK